MARIFCSNVPEAITTTVAGTQYAVVY